MNRPTTATAFGVLNVVFGVMGLAGLLMSWWVFSSGGDDNNPVLQLMEQSRFYSSWMRFSMVLGGLASVVLLAAGVGLLLMKRWGRLASIGYGIYALVMGILSLFLATLFIYGPMWDQVKQAEGPEAAGLIGGLVGGVMGSVFGLGYPIVLLIFMTRPALVGAFDPEAAKVIEDFASIEGERDGSNPYAAPGSARRTRR